MEWKRSLLVGVGWGIGTAVGLAVIVGGFVWYESRPKPPVPPKPWNISAIKAEYDRIDTEGEKRSLVFYYTLENTTDFDFWVDDNHGITMSAILARENNLARFGAENKIDFPIFVPAKKRVRFPVHLVRYSCPVVEKENASQEGRKKYREAVEKYVAETLPNLNGFDLLDESNRYEIVFPPGWKQQTEQ